MFLGWFNASDSAGPEPPHFVGVMIEGPSREGHYFRPRYAAADAEGGDAKDLGPLHIYPDDGVRSFVIHYRSDGNGAGTMRATLDDQTVELEVSPERVATGATLDCFGLLNWMQGGHHLELWVDDLAYTAE